MAITALKLTLTSTNSIDIHVGLSFTFQQGEHILNQFSNIKYSLATELHLGILVAQPVCVRAERKRCFNTVSVLNYSSKHDVRIVFKLFNESVNQDQTLVCITNVNNDIHVLKCCSTNIYTTFF